MKNEDIIGIESIINQEEEDFSQVNEIVSIDPVNENKLEEDLKTEEVISIDKILEEPKSIDEENLSKLEQIKKDKLIEKIQIGLILFLIVFGTLIYFFGYDFFEPFIKID